ncbi:hypothetical protein SEA_BARTIMEAUS_3 [Mycobacterium phage Bartimeaus]|nr:hypothetical protein PBI_OBAMA12_3 [Mycobacterium phage Obama12]YP_009018788.1 hypothetical protein LHTSCC_3 [Mycobacterium phage LHTSCC]YP_009031863.1 hypothetical protein PBI_KAMPY_3 [Mycobacterium phage Kampy]YP_009638660.1 hypothetical protein FGG45_gp03 [Mycobacterium phage Arturo]YP_010062476.1 hypothetical protein KIY69_gp03 [Mycobacterium phage Cerulean]YP_010062568.1 minor tail protein [Mycobacterium phage LeoAvram]YP_010062643.1 hypothetical protein KIY71_gp03 [Mycobacterium phag
MPVIGAQLESDTLVLTRGRDFKWSFENLDATGQPVAFPAGSLFFEFENGTKWTFSIEGALATIKIESEQVALIAARTKWQLVFLPEGEELGGDPIALGQVQIQG